MTKCFPLYLISMLAFFASAPAQSQSAFQRGFQMGSDMYDSNQRNRASQAQIEREEILQRQEQARAEREASRQLKIEAAQAEVDALMQRKHTPQELNKALMQVALAEQDYKKVGELRVRARQIDYDEQYLLKRQEWDRLPSDAKEEIAQKISQSAGIQKFGSWVKGPGKSECAGRFVQANGETVRLPNMYVQQLYALSGVVEVDVTRMLSEQAEIYKLAREYARQEAELGMAVAQSCRGIAPNSRN